MRSALNRRQVLAGAAGMAAIGAPRLARAQAPWPSQPIRLVVPFAPGGTTDIVGRLIAQGLQDQLRQSVVVENRPGAAATVGSLAVAQAAPDGYTLIMSNIASHGIAATLYRGLRYNPLTDFTHIALVATNPSVLVVNKDYEAKTVADVVRLGRAAPDGLDYAVSGVGSSNHLLGLRFAQRVGIKLNPVPYRGAGPALQDVIAGNIKLMFDSLPSSAGHIRQGLLRALAIASETRSEQFPDIPTLQELGYSGLVSDSWFGLSGPKGLPRPMVDRLNAAIQEVLKSPALLSRYREIVAQAPSSTPEQFTDFVRREIEAWAPVVRASGATAN
ncbi:MAG: tripartite tricarboxylate transporter substrate binding protein [Alphaproteobacteria bacterium]|nr:tripartite tricarboxylate transporter substrate binding protein [Alphaproteobacteria bacterium]